MTMPAIETTVQHTGVGYYFVGFISASNTSVKFGLNWLITGLHYRLYYRYYT